MFFASANIGTFFELSAIFLLKNLLKIHFLTTLEAKDGNVGLKKLFQEVKTRGYCHFAVDFQRVRSGI